MRRDGFEKRIVLGIFLGPRGPENLAATEIALDAA
jgi:hypothetical protein